MPSAKTDFIERIRCLDSSIETDAVQNRALTEREHNSIARMLRNGLAVVSFASLEDFIKKRSSEAMEEVSRCTIAFVELPEKLQRAATYEVLSALNYQLGLLDKDDKPSYIQDHALKISSTATPNYELSSHTFAHSQANISNTVIGDILKSFNVEDPWRQMSKISSDLGLTATLSLAEIFKSASLRRHRAAHVAGADTPPTDIKQFVKEAFAIAITFDALLSKAIHKLLENDDDFVRNGVKLSANDIEFRTIKFVDNKWKEYRGNSVRAFRTSNDFDSISREARRRALSSKELLVEFDEAGLVSGWECL
ncbi:HEPN domain-containing protein [Salinibius halmophilus]|uniref:HEPN domain-containing protein n=1 Tax=Salinibius halmophilus TaxID=1853216 RepID=UPI000E663A08|nr:HEPN domain-containing protein [Salinibius halmophilus]